MPAPPASPPLVVTPDGRIAAKGYQEFAQHFPQPGWVEHAPEEIWQATLEATRAVLTSYDASSCRRSASPTSARPCCSGTARRSARRGARSCGRTGVPPRICDRLREEGHEERVTELTGLRLDPYFSGTKLTWLAEHEPHTWALRRVRPVRRRHRRLLPRRPDDPRHLARHRRLQRVAHAALRPVDRRRGPTSCARCSAYRATRCPSWCPTGARSATTDPATFCGLELPIAGIAGDQQSALFGQTCFDAGDAKCTYGTGSFILTNTGTVARALDAGLLTTAAWRSPDGELTYALEGAIFVTGAAVQWLRDGLQIVGSAAETEALARDGRLVGGVVFVPALTGLGAPALGPARPRHDPRPHPRHDPRPPRAGDPGGDRLRGTRRARDDAAAPTSSPLRVDGGASANDLLCRLQADQLGVPVERPRIVETTAPRRGVPRRPRGRRLGLHRRPARDLAARPALRAFR